MLTSAAVGETNSSPDDTMICSVRCCTARCGGSGLAGSVGARHAWFPANWNSYFPGYPGTLPSTRRGSTNLLRKEENQADLYSATSRMSGGWHRLSTTV